MFVKLVKIFHSQKFVLASYIVNNKNNFYWNFIKCLNANIQAKNLLRAEIYVIVYHYVIFRKFNN